MDFEKRKIIITLNDKEYCFYYSCSNDATFQNLLEFFASLVPTLNICQCYQFYKAKDKKSNNLQIAHNSKIVEYTDFLDNLILKKIKGKCSYSNPNYFSYSKKSIIDFFIKTFETNNTNKNKEICEFKKKIQDYQKKNQDYLKKIQDYQNQIVMNNTDVKNFYDVIIHIDSIKDINKGWDIEMSEKGKQNYIKYRNEDVLKIGVIGNANKGKSFILSKISKMALPSGTSIKTEGLSIKYPELNKYKNRRIVLLDSAGLETPVLVSEENIKDEEKSKLFKEKCREKLITELFLQNYIVHNSDILIVVVDVLSFSEQKLLMKVKKEIERSKRRIPLYIIHNLKTYTSIEQVQNYINETLLKSATFTSLKAGTVNTDKIELNQEFKFYEKNNNEKEPNIFQNVFHLIYANENSKAGKYYNEHTLKFIENSYQNFPEMKPYDVIKSIKERFIDVSEDIFEKTEKNLKITKESFDNEVHNKIKLKDENQLILKKCFIDELGFSNLKVNGFEPKYNVYKKDDKIIVRVEAPGNCEMKLEKTISNEYHLIRLKGKKRNDKEPANEDNLYNFREFGDFFLEIPLRCDKFFFSSDDPKYEEKKGVHIIEYKLNEEGKTYVLNQGNEDEDI